MRSFSFIVVALIAAAGCTDKAYDPKAPAIDPNAPRVHITTPARGTIAGDVHTVTVTGTATDDTAVASVTVNDVPATLAADGTWSASVPVTAGTNLLHAIAKDAQGNAGKESRAVVAGRVAGRIPGRRGICAAAGETPAAARSTATAHRLTSAALPLPLP